MNIYETAEFRADDSGIALLRSKFAYKMFTYHDITELHIRRGSVVNNPTAVLFMGVTLIATGVYLTNLFSPMDVTGTQWGFKGGKALGTLVFLVVGLLCFGGILIYKSMKKDLVLEIRTKDFNKSYPLTELRKRRELDSFVLALKEKTGDKLTLLTRELILN